MGIFQLPCPHKPFVVNRLGQKTQLSGGLLGMLGLGGGKNHFSKETKKKATWHPHSSLKGFNCFSVGEAKGGGGPSWLGNGDLRGDEPPPGSGFFSGASKGRPRGGGPGGGPFRTKFAARGTPRAPRSGAHPKGLAIWGTSDLLKKPAPTFSKKVLKIFH